MTREHPRCRKTIIERDLFPAERYEKADGSIGARPLAADEEWSGDVAVSPERGSQPVNLSDGLAAQMRKMLAEGYFRNEGRNP